MGMQTASSGSVSMVRTGIRIGGLKRGDSDPKRNRRSQIPHYIHKTSFSVHSIKESFPMASQAIPT